MRARLSLLVCLFLFAGQAVAAEAWQSPDSMIDKFGSELNLSGQQRLDLQIIAADYQPRLRDLMRIGREIAENLMSVAPDAADYIDQTQAASAAAAGTTAELVVLLAEMRGKLYAVLTDEQRARMQELAEQKREEMRAKIQQKKEARQQGSEQIDQQGFRQLFDYDNQ